MTYQDTTETARIHARAFGAEEGAEISDLAKALQERADTISVRATRNGRGVGNDLYGPLVFQDYPNANAPCGRPTASCQTGKGGALAQGC